MDALPQHIADLIRQGRNTEAIALLREETGVGLAEAADAVERLGAGMDPLPSAAPVVLPADVEALARAGRKIEAIKRLREQTGLGLKEAKDRVEAVPGASPSGRQRPVVVLALATLLVVLGLALALLIGNA